MGRNGLNLGIVGLAVLCLTGCPSETSGDTDGDGDTDTDTDATMTMTMTATMTATMSSTTAMSASESATTDQTTTGPMTTDDMTTTDTDTDTTDSDTDPTTDTDTTTGGTGDECQDCLDETCGELYDACVDDENCNCWLECFEEGNNGGECAAMCDGFMPPGEYGDYLDCINGECLEECASDVYEPCAFEANCMKGLECNMFIGYCSPDCTEEDCPDPATGDAVPECSDFSDNCILPCDDGTTCPDGMDCNFVGGGTQLCTYGP